ncbi:MAG: hypothetical protein A2912_04885 [Candidatus Buchananbacteria bacterium RIFCSPLOWO2_01_FULL_40_23b]|uniref:Uncharacterized protein n=1 Tax=Candidatus Buchananbacteria bacterium RIFCSPLOWO2_01_FULL_40_23b TaxID=1797544 RepID=A0A1G1YPW6_9BACT|nr:MAG: hypothetical protein A2912_04885 [Candidatus Buchananbacteria bacterium RIFCSPLOWO2_01_FULL_40_23b]
MLDTTFSQFIQLTGTQKGTEFERAHEAVDLVQIVVAELPKAREKCASLQVDGSAVSVVELYMAGKTSFEQVKITYLKDGQKQTRTYSIQEFYQL